MSTQETRAKHTPGPWHAESSGEPLAGWMVLARGQGNCVCSTSNLKGRAEANARLIAAAPELLDAAKLVLVDLDHYVSNHGPGPDVRLATLRAAIAKAEGQEVAP